MLIVIRTKQRISICWKMSNTCTITVVERVFLSDSKHYLLTEYCQGQKLFNQIFINLWWLQREVPWHIYSLNKYLSWAPDWSTCSLVSWRGASSLYWRRHPLSHSSDGMASSCAREEWKKWISVQARAMHILCTMTSSNTHLLPCPTTSFFHDSTNPLPTAPSDYIWSLIPFLHLLNMFKDTHGHPWHVQVSHGWGQRSLKTTTLESLIQD